MFRIVATDCCQIRCGVPNGRRPTLDGARRLAPGCLDVAVELHRVQYPPSHEAIGQVVAIFGVVQDQFIQRVVGLICARRPLRMATRSSRS